MVDLAVRLYRRGLGRSQLMAPTGTPVAFPGAEGFGSATRHAYEGSATPTVYKVTNRNASGAGSFRAAIQATDPRIVVFEVSGWIDLGGASVGIIDPYCYVAGQTAPSPGVGIKNGYVYVSGFDDGTTRNAHDVVIRHLSVAPGISISGSSVEYIDHVIWDHCSFFWYADEGMPIYGFGAEDATYSHCICSEGLDISNASRNGSGGEVAAGTSSSARMLRISYVKNLFAHVPRRPGIWVWQQTETAFVNNLCYNPSDDPFQWFGGTSDNGPAASAYTALLGQAYVGGPATTGSAIAVKWANPSGNNLLTSGSQTYISDPLVDPYGANAIDDWYNEHGYDPLVGSISSSLAGILDLATVLDSADVEAYVSANAGSRPAERHSHDSRIVSELAGRTGTIKTASTWGEGSPGTYPTLANNTATFTVPGNAHDIGASGYTVLEELIETYTDAVQ